MKTMHVYCCTDSKPLKKAILSEMSKHQCFFDAINEIVNNIFLKNIDLKKKLTPAQLRKARKFIPLINKIHRCKKKPLIQKKLVNQTGGFIQFVLPLLIPVVKEVLEYAISKKSDSGST